MEWVEVQGKTVEVAIEAALAELGLTSRDEAEVEVIQEPSAGFLGLGGKEAIVKVSTKPKRTRQRRRRSGRSDDGKRGEPRGRDQRSGSGSSGQSKGDDERKDGQRVDSGKRSDGGRSGGGTRGGRGGENRSDRPRSEKPRPRKEDRPESAPIETQAEVAKEFLVGLLDAFGLEGTVETRIEDDILWIDVTGGQTEALVGVKGTVMQSVHEVTRTVIQRKTFGAPRMRLDIAGYAERRREALRIYTQRLTDRLLANGGEIMLEPMNAADRKVVHDTVVEIPGVRSFSEGEDPDRAVVLALEEGYGPIATGAVAEEDDEDAIVLEPRDDDEEE